MRIVYIFTSFPVRSETFLQREIRAMRKRQDVEIELWSLWGGKSEWEGLKVNLYPFAAILRVIFLKIPLWAWRRPGALRRVWGTYMGESSPDLMNIGENLLGLAFALDKADYFKTNPPDLFHGVWGTMPAAACWLLNELTGISFSIGAHAYDIFRNGGDWTIRHKLTRARFIHTSTESARRRLVELGAPDTNVRLIRRGLDVLPDFSPKSLSSQPEAPIHILSIGRLVPKKGFLRQLSIMRTLLEAGIPIEARIVGEGPLMGELRRRIDSLGLTDTVTLTGPLDYADMQAQYAWADVFIFTGVVAENGDRDGLPNVIPEAMAHGVPVITTPVSGTTEAIIHDQTGQVAELEDPQGWIRAIQRLRHDSAYVECTCKAARNWVENEFCAHANASHLAQELLGIAQL